MNTSKTIGYASKQLNCYIKPSRFGEILCKFKPGSKLRILESTNHSWCRVIGNDSATGKFISGYCKSNKID